MAGGQGRVRARWSASAFSQAAFGLKAGGAANGGVLALDLPVEHDLCGGIAADLFIGQEGRQAFLQGAETAFDLAFGLRARGDQRGARPKRRRRVGTRNSEPGHRPWNHGQRG